MPEFDDIEYGEDGFEPPSKSELKRRMTALQELGENLTRLSRKELALIPIESDALLVAIEEARQIRTHSAKRRHLQLIGKLMRDIDPQSIQASLDAMRRQQQRQNDSFHQLEKLRDDVLANGVGGIELVMNQWPAADRQQLRQLVLQHRREQSKGSAPAASRKLFKYLRELRPTEDSDDS